MKISIKEKAGTFAENKDIAYELRTKTIMPFLEKRGNITLDFTGVEGATQSFVHALISEPFRKYGVNLLEKIKFENCNKTIQKIIIIVTEYLQEAEE